jgi:hypothetical protein
VRRRAPLLAVGVLAVLSVISLLGPAARSAPKAPAPSPTSTHGSVAPASTPAPGASGGTHTLTRTERAVLLVTLTFLVGAGLLGPAGPEDGGGPKRPAITLYDDPAALERAAPAPRPAGDPPPLR